MIHSIGKKPAEANYSALIEEIERSPKAPIFKVGEKVSITKNKSFFSKGNFNNCLGEIFFIDTLLKRNR